MLLSGIGPKVGVCIRFASQILCGNLKPSVSNCLSHGKLDRSFRLMLTKKPSASLFPRHRSFKASSLKQRWNRCFKESALNSGAGNLPSKKKPKVSFCLSHGNRSKGRWLMLTIQSFALDCSQGTVHSRPLP